MTVFPPKGTGIMRESSTGLCWGVCHKCDWWGRKRKLTVDNRDKAINDCWRHKENCKHS